MIWRPSGTAMAGRDGHDVVHRTARRLAGAGRRRFLAAAVGRSTRRGQDRPGCRRLTPDSRTHFVHLRGK